MQRLLPFIITLALLLPGETSRSWAATLDAPLRQALAQADTSTEIPVIVTLNNQVTPARFNHLAAGRPRRDGLIKALRKQADESQQDLRLFLKGAGVRRLKPLWTINGLALQATPELLTALAARPEVAEIRLDGTITAPAPMPSAVAGSEWNIDAVGAPLLWEMDLTGSGVVVASLDTGVDWLHPDLAGNYRGGPGAWFDPHNEHTTPFDRDGHGTAVTGVMVGGAADGSYIGMAPAAQWIAAKIFNDAGNASYSGIHQAFAWTLDPDGDGNSIDAPQVVNNSWGLDSSNLCLPEFQPDIQLLKSAGIAVVFSGGNRGRKPASSTSPANYPESLAVGAVDQAGAIASFSSRGPSACPGGDQLFPRLTAPGVNIKSADLTLSGSNPYAFYAGTSFSAPHVSGLIALLLSQGGFPTTQLADLQIALEKGADDLGALGPDQTFGYGLINSLASFRRLAGQPHLAVYDPKPPEHDRRLDFGTLPVGAELSKSLTLRNSGGGLLVLAGYKWTAFSPALTITEDLCSGQSLVSDQTCGIKVRFAPTAPAAFSASLNLSSNDPDFPVVAVSLTGTGNINSTPPTLEIDPAGLTLEFGPVSPGAGSRLAMTLRNSGTEILTIGPITAPAPPFSLVSDGCGNTSLARDESCSMLFAFAPDQLQAYQGQVTITSNDPQRSQVTVILTGSGNHPPTAATLISPANGATGLATSLTLRWLPGTDADGDQITHRVELSSLAPTGAAGWVWPPITMLGLSTLAGSLLLIQRRRRLPVPLLLIFSGALLFMVACGGGGGSSPDSVTYSSYQVTNLTPQTTYIWKVISTDSRGAATESDTWHFTTG